MMEPLNLNRESWVNDYESQVKLMDRGASYVSLPPLDMSQRSRFLSNAKSSQLLQSNERSPLLTNDKSPLLSPKFLKASNDNSPPRKGRISTRMSNDEYESPNKNNVSHMSYLTTFGTGGTSFTDDLKIIKLHLL